MNLQTPLTFASAAALGGWLFAGLRLRTLRQFQGFLASGVLAVRASSYRFCSAALLPLRRAFSSVVLVAKAGRHFQPFRSNPAVKPIRLRRPAYLIR